MNYVQPTDITVIVEAPDAESAIDLADRNLPPGLCASWAGWDQPWSRNDDAEEKLIDVSTERGATVWSAEDQDGTRPAESPADADLTLTGNLDRDDHPVWVAVAHAVPREHIVAAEGDSMAIAELLKHGVRTALAAAGVLEYWLSHDCEGNTFESTWRNYDELMARVEQLRRDPAVSNINVETRCPTAPASSTEGSTTDG